MKKYTLTTTAAINPYFIKDEYATVGIVKNIIFFDPDTAEIIVQHKQGWLSTSMNRSVNDTSAALESMVFVKKQSVDLSFKKPFIYKEHGEFFGYRSHTLYIPASVEGFTFLGERVALETPAEIFYANAFEFGGREYQAMPYTRTELTERGQLLQKICERMVCERVELSIHAAEKWLAAFPSIANDIK